MSDKLAWAITEYRQWRQDHAVESGLYRCDELPTFLADAYLAEHPADDGEPVTEEWLLSVGSNPLEGVANHSWPLTLFVHIAILIDGSLVLRVDRFTATLKLGIANRGDVRLLARALGIQLKEQS